MKCMTKTMELVGSNYETGRKLGETVAGVPQLWTLHVAVYPGSGEEKAKEAMALFERWRPEFNEELPGFAGIPQVSANQLAFYATTNLRPSCSQTAVLPSMTEGGEPLLARNYELSSILEDFTLVRASVPRKCRHMGTSMFPFGKEGGFNEYRLAATMSSCGMLVGAEQGVRRTKVNGLQYWVVIRALLENCQDVEEALIYVKEMPIAFNLSLMPADKSGQIALMETLDGHTAVKRIPEDGGERYLCATNHQVIPELIACEPVAMHHSLRRYHQIREKMDHSDRAGREQLKGMLLSVYPEGVCCYFYEALFGTIRSMVISPATGVIELCWDGGAVNGWKAYGVEEPLQAFMTEIGVHSVPFQKEFGKLLPIE